MLLRDVILVLKRKVRKEKRKKEEEEEARARKDRKKERKEKIYVVQWLRPGCTTAVSAACLRKDRSNLVLISEHQLDPNRAPQCNHPEQDTD